ncbi:hypothetical protein MY11210_005864 [Beauveria gryllotalpidicola]
MDMDMEPRVYAISMIVVALICLVVPAPATSVVLTPGRPEPPPGCRHAALPPPPPPPPPPPLRPWARGCPGPRHGCSHGGGRPRRRWPTSSLAFSATPPARPPTSPPDTMAGQVPGGLLTGRILGRFRALRQAAAA